MNWKFGALLFLYRLWPCSPSVATHCIRQVATKNRTHASALTTTAIKKNIYVYDLLKSFGRIEEAKMLYRESVELFSNSGFKLIKWSANATENRTHASALTTNEIKKNMCLDDLLKSLDTIEVAKILHRGSVELFADSGFELKKWSANAAEIMQNVPYDMRAPSSRLITTENSSSHVHGAMGLQWDPMADVLSLATKKSKSITNMRYS